MKLSIDYHANFDNHYYGAPYTLVGVLLWYRATHQTIELFHKGRRGASHPRSEIPYGYSTIPEHRPASHRAHLPSRLIRWGASIGPHTARRVEHVIMSKPRPEQGYRSALGLLRLGNKHGRAQLKCACEKARQIQAPGYRTVKTLLAQRMEASPLCAAPADPEAEEAAAQLGQANRGPKYYHYPTGDPGMLIEPTCDKLIPMKLYGMANAARCRQVAPCQGADRLGVRRGPGPGPSRRGGSNRWSSMSSATCRSPRQAASCCSTS